MKNWHTYIMRFNNLKKYRLMIIKIKTGIGEINR